MVPVLVETDSVDLEKNTGISTKGHQSIRLILIPLIKFDQTGIPFTLIKYLVSLCVVLRIIRTFFIHM